MKKHILSLIFSLFFVTGMVAQDGSLAYLNQQFPQLTQMYREELKNCHAHYVFAVDVSGSMCKYEDLVKPALEAFVKASPMGDRVTIVPFGREANTNNIGFDTEITAQTKISMVQMLGTLYPPASERRQNAYQYTNIYDAQQAVAKFIQKNAQYDVNIIVFISDLLHCPDDNGNPNNDRQFNKSEMTDMHNLIKSAKSEKAEDLVFTLELPKSGSIKGYIFPQLQEIYADWGVKIIQTPVPENSEALIRQWFEKQKNDIMFMKLQSIIIRENKANPMVVKTETNIDGKVKAHIEWKATKLYPMIRLDSTYIQNSDFYFKPNPDYVNYSEASEMNVDIKLGQIKHKDYGFHQMADTLHFKVELPVPYQKEIDKLLEGLDPALANTSVYCERTIFTFIFPLWLTIAIIILIILYIIGVIKAIGRNNSLRFQANILVYDKTGEQVGEMRKLPKQSSNAIILFGAGGSAPQTRVDDAEWSFEVRKQKGNPFLVFQKPKFVWKNRKGYCQMNKRTGGDLSTQARIQCGTSRTDQTHSVVIKLMNK